MPAGGQHVERSPREVGGDEQLALEGPGGGQPLRGSCQLLVPIGVTDTGTSRSDEHVEGLTGRHEQAGGLTALAGEMFDARQPAPIDVEELADDGVGLRERKQDVRYEHRGLEFGLGCSLAATGARTDDRAQEQAGRSPLRRARVHLAYLCVGTLPVEEASGPGMVVGRDDVRAGDLPVIRLGARVDDQPRSDDGLPHCRVGQREVPGPDERAVSTHRPCRACAASGRSRRRS